MIELLDTPEIAGPTVLFTATEMLLVAVLPCISLAMAFSAYDPFPTVVVSQESEYVGPAPVT